MRHWWVYQTEDKKWHASERFIGLIDGHGDTEWETSDWWQDQGVVIAGGYANVLRVPVWYMDAPTRYQAIKLAKGDTIKEIGDRQVALAKS